MTEEVPVQEEINVQEQEESKNSNIPQVNELSSEEKLE
jgi:hypothetical protein